MAETATAVWKGPKEELERSIYRTSFEEFVRDFWCEVPGSGNLKWNWHLSLFCEVLQEAAERVFKGLPNESDICLNVSPGTSKSSVWSILFPAWCWTRMPEMRFLTASHTDELALDLANKSRSVIKSEKYQSLFPEIEFCEDQDTKGYFRNTLGGDRKTCTVAGKSPTGFHCHAAIVDDPIDPKKVLSEAEVKNAREFMTNVLPSRKVDKKISVTFLIMQRLGVEDPTDVMLKESQNPGAIPVRHICLPAELLRGDDGAYQDCDVRPQELARRYIDGIMDPNRLDRQSLAPFKARGIHYYATQFLQKPYSSSGGMFHENYFNNRVKASPYHVVRRVRYWDRAASAAGEGGCRTAGTLMSFDGEDFYIEDCVVGEWEPHERNQVMLATAMKDRAKYGPKEEPTIWIEAEGGSSGKDAFKAIARVLRGFNVRQQYVSRLGNKATRAEPLSAQFAAGNIYLVDNGESESQGKSEWDINEFVRECCAFPLGKYKDRVDSASGSFSLLAGAGDKKKGLKTYSLGSTKQKGLRIVATSVDQLPLLDIAEHSCLMIHLFNPPLDSESIPIPPHALRKLVDSLQLSFMDIDPADYQEVWDVPLEPYEMLPQQLMMQAEQGKRLWSSVLRKREPPVEVIVIVDEGDNRALSVALAVCDVLALDRSSAIYYPEDPDKKFTKADKAENGFIFDVTKLARNSVL